MRHRWHGLIWGIAFDRSMKMPEFIPFHFDKFNQNLLRKYGAIGIGRWCLIRKAVAETGTLYINLNDVVDRETLELDADCTPDQLTELLDYAAHRGMIDAALYSEGTLWIENLEVDLGRFFTTGKRNLPKKPPLQGKIPRSDSDFKEKFHEVASEVGISTHETKRNETKRNERTNSHVREQEEIKAIPSEGTQQSEEDRENAELLEDLQKRQRAVNCFVENYGKDGKPASIEQAFHDATRYVMETRSLDERNARIFLCQKGKAACLTDSKNEVEKRYRLFPEKWLTERCYQNTFEIDPTVAKVAPVISRNPYAYEPD